MRLLFATSRVHLPDRVGGAQRSVHALLSMAVERGHDCEAIAALPGGPRLLALRAARRLSGQRLTGWPDRRARYITHRSWECLVPELLRRRIGTTRPDVVLTDFHGSGGLAGVAAGLGVPTLLRMVDVGFADRGEPLPDDPCVLPVSNSRFVADRVLAQTGRCSPVVYPIVQQEQVRVERHDPEFVTFINPIAIKGVETVLEAARRLPHRRFLFVESWPLSPPDFAALCKRAEALGNVSLRRASLDVCSVYRRTAILVAPSLVEEAFGRVVLEAQASGIPVVARRAGGIPEAIGEGGLLLPPDATPDVWAQSIERVFVDSRLRQRLSQAARLNAGRAEFAPERIVEHFLAVAERHVRACARLRRV